MTSSPASIHPITVLSGQSVGGSTTWLVTHSWHPAVMENWWFMAATLYEERSFVISWGMLADVSEGKQRGCRPLWFICGLDCLRVGDIHRTWLGWRALNALALRVLKRLAAWLPSWLWCSVLSHRCNDCFMFRDWTPALPGDQSREYRSS